MNLRLPLYTFAFVLASICFTSISAQSIWNPAKGCAIDANGECVPNSVLAAVPFLTIVSDAIGGGMGDAGAATSANPYSMHYNASKLAFAEREWSLGASYTPWLRRLGVDDVYLLYLGGYKKIDDLQTVAGSFRYFNLGQITFTDINGTVLSQGQPREFDLSIAYTRKLSAKLAASVGGKFIYSNLASGLQVGGVDVTTGQAFAADLGMNYHSTPDLGTRVGQDVAFGMSITNLGSKISYTNSSAREFIPTNLRLGLGYKKNIDDYNSILIALDVNKLLIPTPYPTTHPDYDTDQNDIPDFREKSTFGALFSSFGDAPGGFSEELQEFAISLGAEYWYDQQFAVRAGFFYENPNKGNRQYLTVGVGLKYNLLGIDIAYLAPTNTQISPLDNTLRFTFTFNGFGDEAQ